jgi:hypothetical protein
MPCPRHAGGCPVHEPGRGRECRRVRYSGTGACSMLTVGRSRAAYCMSTGPVSNKTPRALQKDPPRAGPDNMPTSSHGQTEQGSSPLPPPIQGSMPSWPRALRRAVTACAQTRRAQRCPSAPPSSRPCGAPIRRYREYSLHATSFCWPALAPRDQYKRLSLCTPNASCWLAVQVIYAGGVTDGRGLVAALAVGCDAVAMGTRFWACEESLGHPRLRQRLAEKGGDHTGIVWANDVRRNGRR